MTDEILLPIFPKKAKRKDGGDIRKLPAAYPFIEEIEGDMKKEYSAIVKEYFLKTIVSKAKEKANVG